MKYILPACILFLLVGCATKTPLLDPVISMDPTEEVACDDVYEPVCAEIQIQCITTPCDPIKETMNNVCEAKNRGAKVLGEGVCETPEMGLPEGEFNINEQGNFFGEFYVRGYVGEKPIPEAFCEEASCMNAYQGLFLYAQEIGNPDFKDFVLKNQYNEAGQEAGLQIMLGCVEDGKIIYNNDSDEYGMTERLIEGEAARNILSHGTIKRQMVVKLTKLPLSGGRGAPACYSHFYDLELFDSLNREF